MISFNPQSIMQLAKLNRAVHKVTGTKYAIGDEGELASLLLYVQDNPNEAFNELFRVFVDGLTSAERAQMQIRSEV